MINTISHLHTAMRSVLDMGPDNVIIAGLEKQSVARLTGRTRSQKHLQPGKHKHQVMEICIPTVGRGVLLVESERFPLSPPAVAIIPRGVDHGEAVRYRRQRYSSLWFAGAGASVLCHLTHYRPTGGLVIPWRSGVHNPNISSLLEPFATEAQETPAELNAQILDCIRVELLAILGELQQCASREPSNEDTPQAPWQRYRHMLERVRQFIDDNIDRPITVQDLGDMTRMTPRYLNRLFRQYIGESIHEYLIHLRMKTALRLCREGNLLVKEIAAMVGYDDPLYFSRAYRKYHGSPPSATQRH